LAREEERGTHIRLEKRALWLHIGGEEGSYERVVVGDDHTESSPHFAAGKGAKKSVSDLL